MAAKKTTESATPNLDLANDPNPTGFRKCRLKEGALPHYVRKGTVRAGDEFVTTAAHAKELFQVGAADILGDAEDPDKAPAEVISEAAAKAEGNPDASATLADETKAE